jgi:hypothetical protein
VIDVKKALEGRTEEVYYYGMKACVGLAASTDGGTDAYANADNYRLFAEAAYLQPRPWEDALDDGVDA